MLIGFIDENLLKKAKITNKKKVEIFIIPVFYGLQGYPDFKKIKCGR